MNFLNELGKKLSATFFSPGKLIMIHSIWTEEKSKETNKQVKIRKIGHDIFFVLNKIKGEN